MAIKSGEILISGDPRLRARAEEVEDATECRDMISRMRRLMESHSGVGLAANQIGDLRRVIVWLVEGEAGELINPVITPRGSEEVAIEGCLSVPGMAGEVRRPGAVKAEGLNEEGRRVSFHADGMLARVIQHEVDHLDGVLFTDRVEAGTLQPTSMTEVVGI